MPFLTPEEEMRQREAARILAGQVAGQVPQMSPVRGNNDATDPTLRSMANQDFSSRERVLANQLRRGQENLYSQGPQGKQAGRVYVAPTWSENLNSAAQKMLGGLDIRRARQGMEDIEGRRGQAAQATGLIQAAEAEEAARQQAATEQDRTVGRDLQQQGVDLQGQTLTQSAAKEAATSSALQKYREEQIRVKDEANRIAALRAGKSSREEGYNEGKTKGEREKFESGSAKASATRDLMNRYKPGYSARETVRAAGLGGVADWADRTLPGDQVGKDAAQFWSDAAKRESKPRHELYGGTLTTPEQKAYNATTFTKNDSPEFIETQLKRRFELERRGTERQAADYLMRNYDPERVQLMFGDVVDVEQLIDDIDTGAYKARVRSEQEEAREGNENDDVNPVDNSDLTPEMIDNMSEEELDKRGL